MEGLKETASSKTLTTKHLYQLHLEISRTASLDAIVPQTAFDALQLGRSTQFVVCRLLRFWESKNIKNKDFVIHGFILGGRAAYYRPSLCEGSVMKVSRFEVARCTTIHLWSCFFPRQP
ncbi:unnamed protein product [Eruca vesicaria subsp. sativa]|uniref:Uncharacterized protein n=1 Tax=Eruca vesicaria subsp. sativa TaxID=29727 RepID=A0ABC8K233_ERUVS|nr:unnamed protein product [Eruca vesicaria subsp. sativa]